MTRYILTFFTHLAAIRTYKALLDKGIEAKMLPTPRALSSSCGAAVSYLSQSPRRELWDTDTEAAYIEAPPEKYEEIYKSE